MATVLKQRDIVDIEKLRSAISSQFDEDSPAQDVRRALFAEIRQALESGRAEIRRRFESGEARGDATVRAQAFLMDQLLRFAYEVTTERVYPMPNPTQGERICLVALGGYGRGELAPSSDIDLLCLMPYKINSRIEQIVESILYL